MSLLDALIASDLVIYPPPEVQRRLFVQPRAPPSKREPLPASGSGSGRGSSEGRQRADRRRARVGPESTPNWPVVNDRYPALNPGF